MTYHVKSDGAHSPTSRLGRFEFDRRSPRPDDIVIEILYCGVCHSDVHNVRNDWGNAQYRSMIEMSPVGRAATPDEVGRRWSRASTTSTRRTMTARVKIDEVSKWVWDGTSDLDKVVIDNVDQLSKARGISMGQMSLAWTLSKPYITAPIVGTTAVRHVKEAVAAPDIQLSTEEIQALEKPYVPHPVLGMM